MVRYMSNGNNPTIDERLEKISFDNFIKSVIRIHE